MSQRYIDGPAKPSVNISSCVFAGTGCESVIGLIGFDAPVAGMAVGALIGLAVGWLVRNVGTQPAPPEPISKKSE